jgi:hypothetical protein
VAKLVIGLYDDGTTARRVVYDLVKHGISRHTIAIVADDAVDVREERLAEVATEQAARFADQITQGRVLIVAWAMQKWVQIADTVMREHDPLEFDVQKA